MMIAETGAATFSNRSAGATGFMATWQCTHSIGSEAMNGNCPTSIWYRVTPSE